MRVLFITNIPSPYKADFFEQLGKQIETHVLYELKHSSEREDGWEKCESHNYNAVFMKGYLKRAEAAFCPEVIKYIRDFRRDVIVLQGYSSFTAMLAINYMILHRIPFILWADGAFIPQKERLFKRLLKRRLIGNASAWLSSGKITTDFFAFYGAQKEKIYQYPLAAFEAAYILKEVPGEDEKKLIRSKLGIEESHMILYAGSFIHRKGVDILIKATNDIEDTAVVFAGGKDLTPYADAIRDGHACKYVPVGFKKADELVDFYKAADIFVFPTREDIWGLVINEAMALGLPIITTDRCIAGLELIENGVNGFICPSEDYIAMEKKIRELLDNEDLRRSMGEANLHLIKEYSLEKMTSAFLKCLADIRRK